MIVIIDYGMGNLGSIKNIIKKLGYKSIITNEYETIKNADKLILPGVGNFKVAMENLKELGLINLLNHKVLIEKTPILGICLGMQLMTNFSEEGNVPGLAWIDAKTIKFKFEKEDIKIPHMGWNSVTINKKNNLNLNFENSNRFYFVHSYFVDCNDKNDILHETNYDFNFTSAFCRENIFGVQYHPEKSHIFGFTLMKNFIESC